MGVRVTFYEHIVPGKMESDTEPYWHMPSWIAPAGPIDLPPDVTVLDCLGAAWDGEAKVWRVLTRRYEDMPASTGTGLGSHERS